MSLRYMATPVGPHKYFCVTFRPNIYLSSRFLCVAFIQYLTQKLNVTFAFQYVCNRTVRLRVRECIE